MKLRDAGAQTLVHPNAQVVQAEVRFLRNYNRVMRGVIGLLVFSLLGCVLTAGGAWIHRQCLAGADLHGQKLAGAYLCGANLAGADLSGADLSGANLSSANLQGANLRRTIFRGAHLEGADLSGAFVSGADFRNADISDSTWTNTVYKSGNVSEYPTFEGAESRRTPAEAPASAYVH